MMKLKKILCLILVGMLALSLIACGAGSPKVDYDTEFDSLMERIEDLGEEADYVATVNSVVWQEAGPDKVASVLLELLTASDASDLSYTAKNALTDYSTSERTQIIKKYKEYYADLSAETETLKTDLKSFKDACGDKHDDGVSALQKYFTKLQAYAEFATDPSGNLMNYRSNHQDFENDMKELKSAAEFDK